MNILFTCIIAGEVSGYGMMNNDNQAFRSPTNISNILLGSSWGARGGWWSKLFTTTRVNLNGNYMPGVSDWSSMIWYGYKNNTVGMKKTSMKIKRK